MIASEHDDPNEMLPVVDERGNIIGAATRGKCHNGSKLLHPVVHLHVFNNKGELYLQKRPHWKDIQPNKWDTAVGGHIALGEDTQTALRREAQEELGLTNITPTFLYSYVFESDKERELVYAYRCTCADEPRPSRETEGGRFHTTADIRAALGKNVLTPNFEEEFHRLSAFL